MSYDSLLSPIKIRNTVFKNRMISTASTPHFLQGTEKAPGEKIISHFANRARNGAAVVTVNHFHQDMEHIPGREIDIPPNHFNLFEYEDASAQNYFCQLIDAIHFYGSKATAYIMTDESWYFDGNLKTNEMLPEMGDRVPDSTEREKLEQPEDFYETYIAPTFRSFVAPYYVLVCREYLDRLNEKKKLPIRN